MPSKKNSVPTIVAPFATVSADVFESIATKRKGRKSGPSPVEVFASNPGEAFDLGTMGKSSASAKASSLRKAMREAGHIGTLEVKMLETDETTVVKSRSGEESWQPLVKVFARYNA